MARLGAQVPTYRFCAPYARTQGTLAAEYASRYGLPPHPWQRTVLDDWLALDEGGRLLNSLCLLYVPRQNGKTGVCDPRETWGLRFRGEWILHTAQEFQTSQKAFDRLREKFGKCRNDPTARHPELNRLVAHYTTSANQMVLDLTNGGHIEFRTRGTGGDAGRGGTFDLIVVDEAQSYTDEHDAALSPLNSAAPHGSPQTILMGTVPDPRKPHKGEVFARLHESARDAPYEGLCVHEWSAPEVGDVLDEARWYEYNPSLGFQLLVSGLRKDSKSMSAETFAREHLGWWGGVVAVSRPIGAAQWDACRIGDADAPDGLRVFSVKFDKDSTLGAVAVAAIPEGDAPIHIELVGVWPLGRGLARFAEFCGEAAGVAEAIVIDGRADAPALVGRLVRDGVDESLIVTPAAADMIDACAGLVEAVRSREVTHIADEASDGAVRAVSRRRIGSAGGYGFASDEPAHAAIAEALALALWKAQGLRDDPEPEMMVG